MMLSPGTRLGPYEIVSPLGAGGMGEVYRARDTRLARDVAVKVLPQHLSASPELRARFEREARTASSLNHPNICTLFDVGREGDTDFLVMELVEGETLADRIARGPVEPAEVLRIGTQVADALDRAHRAGIVHRDLKPGNVMLAKSGAKLMDFGLARVTGQAPGAASGLSVEALTQTPTRAGPLTGEGTIVGTFQYMSPEQLEGREADSRSDLWALGALLHEMATGQHAFSGHSQASLIASILKEEPRAVSQLRPLSPPALDRVIGACLAKDPEQRIQTAHDVKLQLQWIAEGGSQAGVPAPVAARRRRREGLAWIVAGAAAAAAAALGALLVLRAPAPAPVMRFEVGSAGELDGLAWARLSPDGTMLAFLGRDSTQVQRIWIRPLDALVAHPLAGTEGAGRPFWSPDNRHLGYFVEGKLRKVPVAGGPPVTVAETGTGWDGTWGRDGTVLFDGGAGDSIRAVAAGGGLVRGVTRLDRTRGESQHAWPSFLPDGRHFLFLADLQSGGASEIRIGKLGSFDTRPLGTTDGRVEFAPPGFLVFTRERTLMAQPFSLRSMKTTGDPVPVGERIVMGGSSGDFSVSGTGVLAYRVARAQENSQLAWFDRQGLRVADAGPPGMYRDAVPSPDEKRLALAMLDPQRGTQDLWVRDVVRGVNTRLTFDAGDEFNPVWSPDGSRIAYTSNRTGVYRVYTRLVSGLGGEDSVGAAGAGGRIPETNAMGPTGWSPDGSTLVTRVLAPATGWDLWTVAPAAQAVASMLLATPFSDTWACFSPDGRWIAYESSQSGRPEVYVQATSGEAGKWQISNGGGTHPRWRGDSRELFYRGPNQSIMAVAVGGEGGFQAGTPVQLFQEATVEPSENAIRWYPSRDGRRFLLNTPLRSPERERITLVTNWAAELRRK